MTQQRSHERSKALTRVLILCLLAGTACGRPSLHPMEGGDGIVLAANAGKSDKANTEGEAPLPGDGAIDDQDELDESPEFLWNEREDGSTWTTATMNAIANHGQELLVAEPSDVKTFCPTYSSLSPADRTTFWVQLMSAVAYEESAFKTASVYVEKFKASNGKRVKSRGLLQISHESSNLYGCGVRKETELDEPTMNLACGVRIMTHWVTHDGRITGRTNKKRWLGGARYWSVLRSKTKLKRIRNATKSLDICQK